jgi:hypothetical protein
MKYPASGDEIRNMKFVLAILFSLLIVSATVGSARVSGLVYPSLLAVVKGTNNGVYANTLTMEGGGGVWKGNWDFLWGFTASAPTLCQENVIIYGTFGTSPVADLVVRGMDNRIYHKHYSTSSGWSWFWDFPFSGATIDQVACVVLSPYLYVVARGTDNGIYFNSLNLGTSAWGKWVSLNGRTYSPPSLVAPSSSRLDLVVRGTDNGIYHKGAVVSGSSVSWASNWDRFAGTGPNGATLSAPSAIGYASSTPGSVVFVFTRGNDDKVYETTIWPEVSYWFYQMGYYGVTQVAPAATINSCENTQAFWLLAYAGSDHVIYLSLDYHDEPGSSAGGATYLPPALTWLSLGGRYYAAVLVSGTDNGIYFNMVDYAAWPDMTWNGWFKLPGATSATPAFANVQISC